MDSRFAHINAWVFDLDNTLYPASVDLFAQIDVRMGDYIRELLECDAARAREVQKGYFHEHGTTLAGLMRHHGVDPRAFLDYVHDIDMSVLEADVDLVGHIAALPGRKLIFTNGDAAYARRVLENLGLTDTFEDVHDIHATGYLPKPDPAGYSLLCERHGIDPTRTAFFEDMARNLRPAKALGMTTVWIDNGSEWGNHDAHDDHIDFTISHLTPFLADLLGAST